MSDKTVPGSALISTDPARGHTPMARWAVGLAAVVAVVVVVSYTIFAVAYAVGGDAAISDNWVGFLGAFAMLGGLAASLAAFVLAIVAKVKHEPWARFCGFRSPCSRCCWPSWCSPRCSG